MSKEKVLINYFWGKLLGSLFGYLVLNNWFGIVLGFSVGFLLDIIFAKMDVKWSLSAHLFNFFGSKNKLYRKTLFMNLGYLSKADGVVSPQEIAVAETIFAQMNLKNKARARAIEDFQEGKFAEAKIKKYLKILNKRFARDEKLRTDFLAKSLQICFADKPPTSEQINKLHTFLPSASIENLEFERAYQRLLMSQSLDKNTQKTEFEKFKQLNSYHRQNQASNKKSQETKSASQKTSAQKAKKEDFKTIWQNAWDLHKKNQAQNRQRQGQEEQENRNRRKESEKQKQNFEQDFRAKNRAREEAKRQSSFHSQSKRKFDKKDFESNFGFNQGYTKSGAENKSNINYKDYHKLMQAYEILELHSNATASEIKTSYRKLMSKYHPDKLASQRLTPAARIAAKQKMQSVQEAYEDIKKIKGI